MRLCSVTDGQTPAQIQKWKYGTNNYGLVFWILNLFHPMVSFNTPWEHQETSGFFYVFRGLRKIPVALHGLMLLNPSSVWGGIMQKRFSHLFAWDLLTDLMVGFNEKYHKKFPFLKKVFWNQIAYNCAPTL